MRVIKLIEESRSEGRYIDRMMEREKLRGKYESQQLDCNRSQCFKDTYGDWDLYPSKQYDLFRQIHKIDYFFFIFPRYFKICRCWFDPKKNYNGAEIVIQSTKNKKTNEPEYIKCYLIDRFLSCGPLLFQF